MTEVQRTREAILLNPFTPVFGRVPPFMAGRERIIGDMISTFESPLNNPDRCSLFVGARGMGKTSLLTALAYEAQRRGWVCADVTSTKGLLTDVLQRAQEAAADLAPKQAKRRLSSVSVAPLGGVSWSHVPRAATNWRSNMNALLDELAKTDTGLLVTVDEVNPKLDELVQLITTYQHFVREGRKVALLLAGLPHRISALLTGDSTSFLRRASLHEVGLVPRYEVEEAFRLTVETGGRTIEDEALARAVDAIRGFPYLFQLVGYRSWNAAGAGDVITIDDVTAGVTRAQEELADRIFDATYAELSGNDVAFLRTMAQIGEVAPRAELTKRLGRSSSHVSTYKRRLLEAGVIEEPENGTFTFALPGFREYVLGK